MSNYVTLWALRTAFSGVCCSSSSSSIEHVYSTKMSDNTKSLDRREDRYIQAEKKVLLVVVHSLIVQQTKRC